MSELLAKSRNDGETVVDVSAVRELLVKELVVLAQLGLALALLLHSAGVAKLGGRLTVKTIDRLIYLMNLTVKSVKRLTSRNVIRRPMKA